MLETAVMSRGISNVVDLETCPLTDMGFRNRCKEILDETGALVLSNFLLPTAVSSIQKEGLEKLPEAYFPVQQHNIYLVPSDPQLPMDHPRNYLVSSSKGCIQHDQIPEDSMLRTLYECDDFQDFLCHVLTEDGLYRYEDEMSSINLHYAKEGQELGWHFDNSAFAITLLIQKPYEGGEFEYVKDVRGDGDDGYELVADILSGKVAPKQLEMHPGTLVLFRGHNSLHRVTPVRGDRMRMLVGLAYNREPGISLSESARLTFFGRLK